MTETREALAARYQALAKEGKISPEARAANKATVEVYQVDPAEAQAKWVEIYESPSTQAQGAAAQLVASRALRAFFAADAYGQSKSAPFEMLVLSTSSNPYQQKNGASAGQWNARGFGLFRSLSPEAPFEGPAGFTAYGLIDPNSAKAWMQQLVPGQTYRIKARLNNKSPTGKLSRGAVGAINITAADAGLAPVANGHAWPDVPGYISEHFPRTDCKQVYEHPVEYAVYLLEGSITRAQPITPKKGGGMMAIVQIIDDSISLDKDALTKTRGGISIFLSPDWVRKVNDLVRSTVVRTLVSCGKREETDPQGKLTGNVSWTFNALSFQVLVQQVGGSAIPNPGAGAVDTSKGAASPAVPPPPPPTAPGVASAAQPSATDM